jgi:hypothetical protein
MSDFLDGSSVQSSMYEGYGQAQTQDDIELYKAIIANDTTTNIADFRGGGALQMQNLETQLALLTFQEKHIKFFKDIGIVKANSTLEEYSTEDGYGKEGGFVDQLGIPAEDDVNLQRNYAIVKYVRTMWRVGDVLQLTNMITNAEIVQVQGAMMRTLRILEKTLFFGDSTIIPQSFDGIIKTIKTSAPGNVFDLRGATISELQLRLGAEMINSNFGTPTKLYVSNSVKTSIDNILPQLSAQRLLQNNVNEYALGSAVTKVNTSFGDFVIEPDVFINPESQGVPKVKNSANVLVEGPTANKAPGMPNFTISVQAPTVAGSYWATTGSGGAIAGTYYYRVVAVNYAGKSQAAAATISSAVAAGGSITLTINPGSGPYAPTGYEIYRGTSPSVTGDDILYMASTPYTAAGQTYVDLNADLPGTSQAVLVDNTTVGEARTMAMSQLAPIHRVQYAKIGPYKWGTVNYYGVPKFYAPMRYVYYKNVGIQKAVRSSVLDL